MFYHKTGVVLMTALLPTTGHQYLIEFASQFVDRLYVIICTRSHEPARVDDFYNQFMGLIDSGSLEIYEYKNDAAPQNPEDMPNVFWRFWKDVISMYFKEPDFIFASEPYGQNLADQFLDCTFIPVDISREVIPVKSTNVRQNLDECWTQIMPATRRRLTSTITFFGAESTGKTTLSRKMARSYDSPWLHEWARPYLETVGEEVTPKKMDMIWHGQMAAQNAIRMQENISPFIMLDTDLMSTVGYFELKGWEAPRVIFWSSDLYIVMNNDIPFTPDPLRYGGDKRETDVKYWTDILDRHGLKYHVMKSTNPNEQQLEAMNVIDDFFREKMKPYSDFVRD